MNRSRNICLIIMLLLLSLTASAQKHGIGLHFGAYDFYGPQTNSHFLSDKVVLDYNRTTKRYDTVIKRRLLWDPLVKFTYWFQLNRMFDVNMALSLANVYYPSSDEDAVYKRERPLNQGSRKRLLAEYDLRFNYNILPKEDFVLSPYLFAGLGASYHDIYFGANIPLGIGLNVNLNKDDNLFLNLESSYKVAVTEHNQNHLQHTIGFVYWFKPGYRAPAKAAATEVAVAPEPVVADSDGDGINDDEDQCPSLAGTAQFNGCPDSDGDGISDKDDSCPMVAGLAQFNGCPDSDGDGVSDRDDKCPYVAGLADRQGCPVPDKDNDGFNDDEDRCPDVYSKTNQGCPEIRKEIITQVEKAAKAIFFETGKSTIKNSSFKSLDAVVRVLKSDPTLFADIEGHTDDVGDDAYNMTLSQERAEAVRKYFMDKGIDGSRLTAQGFGETQPVADNGTAAGKAQNRRTVIKLRNYSK